ncbi:MAG: hypothetical protein WC209_06535 [Ignavibacteriaceae bacterium]|jgi:hypothetical protein
MEINEAELEKEIENDLRTNPKYTSFFNQYSKSSVDLFINDYKKKKVRWLTYGERYMRDEQHRILRYNSIAEQKLWEIQQVKLFNTQCLWRSEQIKIPQIEIAMDFVYWEKAIENCPFLSPISEEEYNLYREYMLTDEADTDPDPYRWSIHSWQNYGEIHDSFIDEDDDDSTLDVPEWYLFYFNRTGYNPCSILEDIRGQKEDFYRTLYFNRPEVIEQRNKPQPEYDKRPYFHYYTDEAQLNFIEQFEERKVIEYAKALKYYLDLDNDDELEAALDTLKKADERIEIISPNDDWRTAVIRTANQYVKRKIYAALEHTYKSYLRRLNLGIAFEFHNSTDAIESKKELAAFYKKTILEGRKLNNEPEDFNF